MLIEMTSEERLRVLTQLKDASSPSAAFYVLVALSTGIAAWGLLANSTAVVIGAMLIAPLMGPIFGITLGLVRGNRWLFFHALIAEVAGVLMAVLLAWLIGILPLRPDFGSEILSRTQPTLFDVLIAFFSGLAGAYAMVNSRISSSIAGVAIATALVPPLATCGLCLAAGNLHQGFGAFLLFFINFLAIQFAAAIVFMLAGMGRRSEEGPGGRLAGFARKFGPGLLLLLALSVYLTNTLVVIVREKRTHEKISSQLSDLLDKSQGAQLQDLHFETKDGQLEVRAEVVTPQEFTPGDVAVFEDALREGVGIPLQLILRSLISRDYNRDGAVFITDDERLGRSQRSEEAKLLQDLSGVISDALKTMPGALLYDLRLEPGQGKTTFTATVHSPDTVLPETVAQIERRVSTEIRRPVKLIVRSILTRDADAERFIHSKEAQSPMLSEQEQQLQAQLETALRSHLTPLISGSALTELRFVQRERTLLVSAEIRAPRAITPGEVGKLEEALRTEVRPELQLLVQTEVLAFATAEGYTGSGDLNAMKAGEDAAAKIGIVRP